MQKLPDQIPTNPPAIHTIIAHVDPDSRQIEIKTNASPYDACVSIFALLDQFPELQEAFPDLKLQLAEHISALDRMPNRNLWLFNPR
jgi:hypothetical protein